MNNIEDKKSKLIKIVNEVLDDVFKEIDKNKQGNPAYERQHLLFIQSVLVEILNVLETNNLNQIITIKPDIARIVIDTWPLNDVLGDKICLIEYEFNLWKKHKNKKLNS